MLWFDAIAQRLDGAQVVNDSKTPSGRVHVGALRGVVIHDAVFRALSERGLPATYLFGVDDYDPLDELPPELGAGARSYLGMPLCNVPPPPGSTAPDLAEHYIRELFQIFAELGVDASTYRMRDVYRSGRFNEAIDAILRDAAVVRTIYKSVSGSDRPSTWLPFQVVCEQCGRIGTTDVSSYDGRTVAYHCRADLVTWATGCSYRGRISPFDGRGKLPWKLEWTAKWHVLGVTVEGAGKDHNTRGGSRDVAAECLRRIFAKEPPVNVPYEFLLVSGAKMSSSRGIGAPAREVASALAPEVLRFLMLRPQPSQPVNFAPDEKSIIKLFNDFDRCLATACDPALAPTPKGEAARRLYDMSQVEREGCYYPANFQLLLALVQLPHVDAVKEIERRKGSPLTDVEVRQLERRIRAALYWLNHYAEEHERLVLREVLPRRAGELTQTQRAFLQRLAAELEAEPWTETRIQAKIFEVARLTPIEQPPAFQAVYRVLFDRDDGPKAGNVLAYLDRSFVRRRFLEVPVSKVRFWEESAITREQFEQWLEAHRGEVVSVDAHVEVATSDANAESRVLPDGGAAGLAVIEFELGFRDGKRHMKRVAFERFDQSTDDDGRRARERTAEYLDDVVKRFRLPVVGTT